MDNIAYVIQDDGLQKTIVHVEDISARVIVIMQIDINERAMDIVYLDEEMIDKIHDIIKMGGVETDTETDPQYCWFCGQKLNWT